MKLNEESIQSYIAAIPSAPELALIAPEEVTRMQIIAKKVLEKYSQQFGPDAEFDFSYRKRFTSVELRLYIPGSHFDPLLEGSNPIFDRSYELVSNLLIDRVTTAFFVYGLGKNLVTLRAPRHNKRKLLKNPMLMAVLLGIFIGFLCRLLPEGLFHFVIDDLVTPVSDVLLKVLSGIMGPVLFFSLVSSVTTLNSISELNTLGRSIIRRFLIISISVAILSIGVCILMFGNLGDAGTSFAPRQIISLILNIVPTNLLTPFTENNTAQIIVLGLVLGAALLLMAERANALKSLMCDMSLWLNTFMRIVTRISPLVPCLSLLKISAEGGFDVILDTWKFLLGVLLCMLVCAVGKIAVVSVRRSLSPLLLLKKLRPLVLRAFAAGSTTPVFGMQRQMAESAFGIRPSYTEFWFPMCYAMLNPTLVINIVVPTFFAASSTGVPVSSSFLLVLFLLSVQLSLASSGTTTSWVIVFTQLSLPLEFVGVFSASKIVIKNFTAAFSILFLSLEQIDAACADKAVDESVLRNPQLLGETEEN